MRLKVLGSSSKGNCYILENDTECLIMEAGISLSTVKEALKFTKKKVVGCIVTHRHGDHANYALNLMSWGINLLAHEDVFDSIAQRARIGDLAKIETRKKVAQHGKVEHLGGFAIRPLSVDHDEDVPCFCYQIAHKDIGVLLFATDFVSMPYKFNNLSVIMIEANYMNDIMDHNVSEGVIDEWRAKRTRNSHCELGTAIKVINAQNLCDVRKVILLHLSGENADGYHFQTEVERQTGIPTTVARSGLTIELSKI